jgi:hypothetical protein
MVRNRGEACRVDAEHGRRRQSAAGLVVHSEHQCQKRPSMEAKEAYSKEVSRGFIRGGPVTHNLSSLPGLVS